MLSEQKGKSIEKSASLKLIAISATGTHDKGCKYLIVRHWDMRTWLYMYVYMHMCVDVL